MQLMGKIAIITGAATGLGLKTAEVFIQEGARVATIGRRLEKLKEAEAAIKKVGGELLTVQGDMGKPEDVKRLVDATVAKWGGLDIVVNNAGIHAKPALTHETSLEEFDAFLNINLRGPFMLVKEAVPHMLRRGGGAIVNISSIVGVVGVKYCVSYGTAKGGMLNMTRAMAMDYADKGIRVNCVAPFGMSPTESTRLMSAEEHARLQESLPRAPIGRQSTTDEVAHLILFLVGPYSGNMTGAIIPADGGYTAR